MTNAAPGCRYTVAHPVCWRTLGGGRRDPGGMIWITIFHLTAPDHWLVAREAHDVAGLPTAPTTLYRGPSDQRALACANRALRDVTWREFATIGDVVLHLPRAFGRVS